MLIRLFKRLLILREGHLVAVCWNSVWYSGWD